MSLRQGRRRVGGAVLLVTALLAGCGSETGPTGSDGNSLTVWIRLAAGGPEATKALLEPFEKQTGISVEIFASNDGFETKLAAAAGAHQLPDVVINDAAGLGGLQSQGIIQEIDRAALTNAKDVGESAWTSVLDRSGRTFGVPISSQANLLLVRSDWMTKFGFSTLSDWDQFLDYLQQVTTGDPDGNGKADTYGLSVPGTATRGYISWNWSSFLWQAGGDYFSSSGDGRYVATVNSPEAVTAAEWYKNLFCTQKVVQPGAINADTTDAAKPWYAGQIGSYLTGPNILARTDDSSIKDTYRAIAPPAGPAGAAVLAEGTTAYLMAGSANSAGALKLMDYLIGPQAQELGTRSVATAQIIRLPVNTTVPASKVYGDNENWKVEQQVFASSARYEPQYMPNWTAFRAAASEQLNALVNSCGDTRQAMDTLQETFTDLLDQQGVLAAAAP